MLQHHSPETFVLATNETHTVKKFVELSFNKIEIQLEWKGTAENEKGYCSKSGRELVSINPKFYRPAEVELLIGDAKKANDLLNWKPTTGLEALCSLMVDADLKRNKNGFSF